MDVLIQWVMALIEWVKCIPNAIFCSVTAFANYLVEMLQYMGKQSFALLVKGIVGFFELIPVPEVFTQLQGYLSSVSSMVGWIFNLTQFQYGLTVVFAAYVIKFIIRRLPVVG